MDVVLGQAQGILILLHELPAAQQTVHRESVGAYRMGSSYTNRTTMCWSRLKCFMGFAIADLPLPRFPSNASTTRDLIQLIPLHRAQTHKSEIIQPVQSNPINPTPLNPIQRTPRQPKETGVDSLIRPATSSAHLTSHTLVACACVG